MPSCFCILLVVVVVVLALCMFTGKDESSLPRSMDTAKVSEGFSSYAYRSSWGDNVADGAVWGDDGWTSPLQDAEVWGTPSNGYTVRSSGPLIEMLPPDQLL